MIPADLDDTLEVEFSYTFHTVSKGIQNMSIFNSDNTIFDFKERQLDHRVEEKTGSSLRSHFRNHAEIEVENCNAVQVIFSWVSHYIRGKKCRCLNQKCRTLRPCLIGEVKDTIAK